MYYKINTKSYVNKKLHHMDNLISNELQIETFQDNTKNELCVKRNDFYNGENYIKSKEYEEENLPEINDYIAEDKPVIQNNDIRKYIKYKKMMLIKRSKKSDNMRLVEYINDKYQGVHITISLLNGETLTGEVVRGFENILLLKVGDVLTHIDGEYIVSFF